MAVIVSDSSNGSYNGYLSTTNGFYRAEAYNLGAYHSTRLTVSTERLIPVTFANGGNCMGIILSISSTSAYTANARGVLVELQENVSGSWTTRVSKELTTLEIFPEHADLGYPFICSFLPFKFATPYAVDTTANKWRFRVYQGTTGVSSIWSLTTSDATNPSFVAWCDTQVTSADDDVLIVADKVIIDKSITLKGTAGIGETTTGVCGWICSSNDISPENICLLEWDSTPAASYTLTLGGNIMVGSLSGFRVGTETNRIPFAQRAIIKRKATLDYGSLNMAGFRQVLGTSASAPRARTAIFLYGEVPEKPYAILSENAVRNQPVFKTTEDMGAYWSAGDKVFVGKQNYRGGQGTIVQQEIQSISGDTITLTSNLLSYDRISGGTILNFSSPYGISIEGIDNIAGFAFYFEQPLYAEISGCIGKNVIMALYVATSYYGYPPVLKNTEQYIIEDNMWWVDNTSNSYVFTLMIPRKGCIFRRNLTWRTTLLYTCYSFYVKTISYIPFNSGVLEFYENRSLARYSITNFTGGVTNKLNVHDNVFENSSNSQSDINFNGIGSILRNNYHWGCATTTNTWGTISMASSINGRAYNNTYEFCNAVYSGLGQAAVLDFRSSGDIFINNVYDIQFYGPNYYDVLFDDLSRTLVFDDTLITDTVSSSTTKITNEVGINYDKVKTSLGEFKRTGYNLVDTTAHTEGNDRYALRFEPKSDAENLSWSQDIPTGNIQNKTMAVSVWIKINSAAYYADIHNNPTLSIFYDNTSTVESVATNTTEWQLVTAVITPLTTYPQITVSVKGLTNATSSDAYFYVDDMSVLMPAGTSLNLGGMDLWAKAMPVTPSIATIATAADVWNFSTSLLTAAGTIGKQLVDNDTAIVDVAKLNRNKAVRSGNTLIVYDDDGVTPYKTFDLNNYGRIEI